MEYPYGPRGRHRMGPQRGPDRWIRQPHHLERRSAGGGGAHGTADANQKLAPGQRGTGCLI